MATRREWRCSRCRKLLGEVEGERLHIEFARGHRYIASLPAMTTCRRCGVLNELPADGRKS